MLQYEANRNHKIYAILTARDGLETETSRDASMVSVSSRNVCYRLGLVIQGLGSRLGFGRLGLEPMSYFPLSREEKHVTTRPLNMQYNHAIQPKHTDIYGNYLISMVCIWAIITSHFTYCQL
jgi:hypothetical protein